MRTLRASSLLYFRAMEMARKRWDKQTTEQKREYAMKMVEAKRLKRERLRLEALKKPTEPK